MALEIYIKVKRSDYVKLVTERNALQEKVAMLEAKLQKAEAKEEKKGGKQ
jgi:hypothetical protein